MAKLYLTHFYVNVTFLFSRWIICSGVSFFDHAPSPGLYDTLVAPKFGSHESVIKESMMNQAREALGHFLAVARTTFKDQANEAQTDCLELYEDGLHHLNTSTNTKEAQKWLRETIDHHQECQNGFNLSSYWTQLQNFLKSVDDNYLQVEDEPLSDGWRLIQSIEGGALTRANIVVAQDGSGEFKRITGAMKAAEKRRTGTDRFVIYVKAGVYKENIIVKASMTNLTLIGDGIDATIITNNKSHKDGYSTLDTTTFQVWGAGFVAIGITFENTAGPVMQQAVALLSASDLSAFYKCSFKGYQDTLYLHQNRQFYRECDIYGTVDLIFGNAAAVLQNCNIYVRNPVPGQENVITAQGRMNPSDPTGFVIHNSHVTAARDLGRANVPVKTFLGRPWKDYSRVVYVKCYLHSLIHPQGWMPFPGISAFGSVYYAEYKNNGKGAGTGGRVSWPGYHVLTNVKEAEQFSVGRFLSGESWIPRTGVPFNAGL